MKRYELKLTHEELRVIFWALNSHGIDPRVPEVDQDIADRLLIEIHEEADK